MTNTFKKVEPVIAEIGQGVDQLYTEADAAETATRDTVRTWMLTALALEILLMSCVSALIGRSISRALSAMVAVMIKLAGGEVAVTIPGLGRKDEVGEMAGAVEIFKNNMIEAERLRTGQLEAEQRHAGQRKADMQRLADQFESAVGQIIETVSTSATELEASAVTLTTTAERSEKLATMVATASEEASTNVQSVASASEQLSSSVSEIS